MFKIALTTTLMLLSLWFGFPDTIVKPPKGVVVPPIVKPPKPGGYPYKDRRQY